MRIVITGAAGQVGRALLPCLERHEVIAPSHADLDVTDRESVEQAIGTVAPDAIVNCAGITNVDECERDPDAAFTANALAVRFLAVAAARCGAHLVQISTDYVFDGRSSVPYREWDPPAPISAYGRSKLAGEEEARSLAPSWAILRTAWVFGRRGHDFVSWVLDTHRAGNLRGAVDEAVGAPTYAPDVAAVLARITLERRAGVFHATNAGSATRHDLAAAVLSLTGADPSGLKRLSEADLDRPAPRPAYSVLDTSALAAHGLGPLRPWHDALAEYVKGAT